MPMYHGLGKDEEAHVSHIILCNLQNLRAQGKCTRQHMLEPILLSVTWPIYFNMIYLTFSLVRYRDLRHRVRRHINCAYFAMKKWWSQRCHTLILYVLHLIASWVWFTHIVTHNSLTIIMCDLNCNLFLVKFLKIKKHQCPHFCPISHIWSTIKSLPLSDVKISGIIHSGMRARMIHEPMGHVWHPMDSNLSVYQYLW